MDIARYFIKNKTTSWLVTLILLIGGLFSYFELGRLEDPQFTLKQALVITEYPGASPMQVEEEVTYRIENAIQSLPYVDNVESVSSNGLSQVMVEMKSHYRKQDLRQIWDELRRKINDLTPRLPIGASPPMVKDDFGDVFGILMMITGDGFDFREISDSVDYMRRELVLVEGVGKIDIQGKQIEQVVVEISRAKLTSLGISPQRIYSLLDTQNTVSNAGNIKLGAELIRFRPTGEFQNVAELKSLVISNPGAEELIYLGDVAEIFRDYQEIPQHILRYNGKKALSLGVSFASGVNVVDVGARINKRVNELEALLPVGINIDIVYNQPKEVENSVSGFVLNLLEAVVIVILVLLVFMGVKSGLLIGLILFITVVGSFIFMKQMDIELQRISLGALIIALGMLVDNAIVITEGILIGIKRGMSKIDAASLIVKQTKWPLLGATVIAVTAFAPIGLSSDATGEFAGSLFWVLLISLMLSWFTAITLTPFLADVLIKESDNKSDNDDPYKGIIFVAYKKILTTSLHHRALTVVFMIALLIFAVVMFGKVKQAFFPPSNTPMFLVDIWQPEGTDIRKNAEIVASVEQFLLAKENVEEASTTIGRGATRFMLTYQAQKTYPAFAQVIVRADQKESLVPLIKETRNYLTEYHPDLFFKIKRLEIGPSTDAKIEARFSGPDPKVLRELSKEAQAVLKQDNNARNIRDDWREQTKVIRPVFNEVAARRVGITKQDLDDLLLTSFSGKKVGIYRDGTTMLPIISRPPSAERLSIESLKDLQIYSPTLQRFIPITQVVSDFKVEWENPLIQRRDRKRTITVYADHDVLGEETAAKLLSRLKPKIEAIELPTGYMLEWGGEFEAAQQAQKAIFGPLPLGFLVMFVITVLLFNSAKTALSVWSTVPLAIVGVSIGLLVMGAPFGFMALLGFLSLSGMMLKNGIVLAEQINIELEENKAMTDAIYDAAVSRVRPVSMAAITTILGMIPLLFDDFFASMAVVIMFGLGFATLLTLIFMPVVYSLIYKVKYK
ncbi:efflux RND transporter permease subunit [Flocculibacter collagenilyticus]|uniref:efflux RND transporter permease subunit n=1 Tax=Flocculibacter collagenilyticus TaxID=2744479 RepID=UPI0018F3C89E|nr:efflux RND transporter permease subunit [Flocculibacter collagenilyticus]